MRNTCIHCDSHGYMNYVYSLPWSQIYKLRALNAVATDILTSTFISVGTDIPNVCFHELGVFTAILRINKLLALNAVTTDILRTFTAIDTDIRITCFHCHSHGYTDYLH